MVLNSGKLFQICSVSKSAYRTTCFFMSSSSVIWARSSSCSKSSKNLGSSQGLEVLNLGAACSLRIGIGIGCAISGIGMKSGVVGVVGVLIGMKSGLRGIKSDNSVNEMRSSARSGNDVVEWSGVGRLDEEFFGNKRGESCWCH